jgi:hypothetical protein
MINHYMYKIIYFMGILVLGTLSLKATTVIPEEQVSVSTDKDVYIAGDWVYFSILLHDQGVQVSDYVYVSLNDHQNQVLTGCLKVNNNAASGSFYLADTLNTGIYQMVSYTNHLRNYGTNGYAIKNILIVNRFEKNIQKITEKALTDISDTLVLDKVSGEDALIQLNKESFFQREPVTLHLQLPHELKNAIVAVSVRKVAPVALTEDRATIPSINRMACCRYLSERSGMILQGYVKDPSNGASVNKTVFLSCEDSIANLQYAQTSSKGEFRFFLNPYYFGKHVAVKLQGEDKSPIQIEPKYFKGIVGNPSAQIRGDLEGYLLTEQKYISIQRSYDEIYRLERPQVKPQAIWRPEVYSRKIDLIRPADYYFLPDFRQISQELLMYFKIRERKNEVTGTLIDINQKEFGVPYIFLDGILLEHARQIVALNSKQVKTIGTIPNARLLGDIEIPGILDIHSNHSEIKKVQWRYSIALFNVDNPMRESIYNVPELGKMPRQIPFYLPLLYWNPSLKIHSGTTSNLSFYTSDCTGTFEVVVKGFSADGNEISFRKVFEVYSKK